MPIGKQMDEGNMRIFPAGSPANLGDTPARLPRTVRRGTRLRRETLDRLPLYQTSLKRAVRFEGRGVHSNGRAKMEILPGLADTGIVFVRTDVPSRVSKIPASRLHVVDSCQATTIANADGISVRTVEHVLAALAGLHIDNAVICLDGDEVPIIDGCAHAFVRGILRAGVCTSDALRIYLHILEPVKVEGRNGAHGVLTPAGDYTFDVDIDFPNPHIGRQHASFSFTKNCFASDVASARTFCSSEDTSHLQNAGFGHGASLANTLVINPTSGVVNAGGVLWDNEPARHKLLDAIGDLYLLGAPILGQYKSFKGGHALNHAISERLLENSTAFRAAPLLAPARMLAAE